jgi:hypothetical protein
MKMVFRFSLLVYLLCGCATTGTPAGTFTQAVTAAEAADDAIVTSATALLQAGTITSTQAKKVLTITDGINTALTLANNAYTAGNLTSANSQISAVTALLTQVQACMNTAASKQPIDTCLAPLGAP